MFYREAHLKFHVPKSTTWDRLHAVKAKEKMWYCHAFSPEEEQVIVNFNSHSANRAASLGRREEREAAELLISTISKERRQKIPFANGKPGDK